MLIQKSTENPLDIEWGDLPTLDPTMRAASQSYLCEPSEVACDRSFIFHRNLTTNQPINLKAYKRYFFSKEILKPLQYLPETLQSICNINYQKREEWVWKVIEDMEKYLGVSIEPIDNQEVHRRGIEGELFDMHLPIGERTDLSSPYVQILQNKYDTKQRTFTGFYNEYYTAHHKHNLRQACGNYDFVAKFEPRTQIEIQCHSRLLEFLTEEIFRYDVSRTKIDSTGTSRLSPYLALGVMSFEHLISIFHGSIQPSDGHKEFDRQCHWILYSKLKAPYSIGIPTPLTTDQQTKFTQWANGELFEANQVDWMVNNQMKKLKNGQVVSNRFRLMVTNYLVKRLEIDWRYGEFYFEAALIDSHPEVNRKNWEGQMRSRFFNNYNLDTQLLKYSSSR